MWEEIQERSVARVENLSVWGVCASERDPECTRYSDAEGNIPLKVHTYEGIFENFCVGR